MDSLRLDKPLNTSKSLRILQDFVDISVDHRTHFLGSDHHEDRQPSTSRYHQVNTCLMSIVVGNELGLTKPQLRDFGYIALFHDAGMGTVPDNLLNKRGALTPEEKALVARARSSRCATFLREKAINRGDAPSLGHDLRAQGRVRHSRA
jgi:response regulator RpfG family c-di-GMP phosphodiesterase